MQTVCMQFSKMYSITNSGSSGNNGNSAAAVPATNEAGDGTRRRGRGCADEVAESGAGSTPGSYQSKF